jgi:hypothetical protein
LLDATGAARAPRLLLGLAAVVLVARGAAAQPCQSIFDCSLNFDQCTIVSCDNGQCNFTARNCNDGDPCTTDGCNSNTGCVHGPRCPDDGLVCNGAPTCIAIPNPPFPPIGICEPPIALDCNLQSMCSIDSCVEPLGCQHVAVDCDDGNVCTVDSCDVASGCHHDPVDGCCRTGRDCATDACATRDCTAAHVCTDPVPISCDDGDPSTVDACDPSTGCTHTPGGATTTTLPGEGSPCATAGDCASPADPCVRALCDAGRCTTEAVVGLPGLACVCQRTPPAECAGQSYPKKLTRFAGRACALIGNLADASGRRRVRSLKKTIRLLKKAEGAAMRSGDKGSLTKACGDAAGTQFGDGVSRANALQGGG